MAPRSCKPIGMPSGRGAVWQGVNISKKKINSLEIFFSYYSKNPIICFISIAQNIAIAAKELDDDGLEQSLDPQLQRYHERDMCFLPGKYALYAAIGAAGDVYWESQWWPPPPPPMAHGPIATGDASGEPLMARAATNESSKNSEKYQKDCYLILSIEI